MTSIGELLFATLQCLVLFGWTHSTVNASEPVVRQVTRVGVSKLDGAIVQGELTSLSVQQVGITVSGKLTLLPVEEVLTIRMSATTFEKSSGSEAIITSDQSNLVVEKLVATTDQVTAQSAFGELAFDRNKVRALRLRPQNTSRRAEWLAFLKRANDKDMLIVEKRDQSGLDFLAGVVSEVDSENVSFLLNGRDLSIPRDRVFGVVFAKAEKNNVTGDRLLKIRTTSDQIIQAATVELDEQTLIVDTSWGDILDVPLQNIREIDFSSSRLQYLSDLDPLTEVYFGLNPPGKDWDDIFKEDQATRTGFSRPWKMSRDRFPNNGRPPLSLKGKTYQKGLCLFPKVDLEFALDESYSRLQATVGVDDEVALYKPKSTEDTRVQLTVLLDGEPAWQKLIASSEDPVLLDIDVSNASTLQLSVDFGDSSSERDYLDLANARLLLK